MRNVLNLRSYKRSKELVLLVQKPRAYSTNSEWFTCNYPDIKLPDVNVVEYVTTNFGKWPNKIALECGVTKRKYTYDDLRTRLENFAQSLLGVIELKRGDVVAVLLPNVPEYPICTLGILLAGMRITTINPIYTAGEIQRQLADSNAKALITMNDNWSNAKLALDNLNLKIPVVIVTTKNNESIPFGLHNFQELSRTKRNAITQFDPLKPDDVIHIPYSSGTTGLPKGVMLTNSNISSNIVQFHSPAHRFIEEASESHQDVLPVVLPMFHIYGFTICMLSLLEKGCKLVTVPKFTPETFLDVLNTHKPHAMQLVPPIVIFLNSHPQVKREYLENVRTVLCGAAPLGALDEDKFKERAGRRVQVLQGYGLTETSPTVMAMPIEQEGKHPGSIGHPFPNTLIKVSKLDDPLAKHLGPNETGELLIKGPQVMKGYFNKPEETERAFVGGWFRTGDLVRYDENGVFYIADRIKELIKVKGFQVPPAELEEIIRDFPGVAEAAVVGVPHEYSGEVPRAYVVPKVNQKVNPDELRKYVESKVANYKKLAGGVVVTDSIPKTASGKILRRQIKEKYLKEGI